MNHDIALENLFVSFDILNKEHGKTRFEIINLS